MQLGWVSHLMWTLTTWVLFTSRLLENQSCYASVSSIHLDKVTLGHLISITSDLNSSRQTCCAVIQPLITNSLSLLVDSNVLKNYFVHRHVYMKALHNGQHIFCWFSVKSNSSNRRLWRHLMVCLHWSPTRVASEDTCMHKFHGVTYSVGLTIGCVLRV